jgi:hypothetical protein
MGTAGIRREIAGCSPSQVEISARVQGAANSNPSTIKGATSQVASVTRLGVGRYRIFLREAFPQAEQVHASVQDTNYATAASKKVAKVITHNVSTSVAASRYIDVAVHEPSNFVADELTDPLAAAAAGLRAATATTVAPQTVLTAGLLSGGLAELLARPRNVTFTTAGGTPADAPATALITGTDIHGDPMTETVNIAQTATIASGVEAFRTITSIAFAAAEGTNATVSIGYGNAFGLRRKAKTRAGAVMRGTEISAGSVVTNGTLVTAETSPPNGTYTPNAAPNGTNDYAIAYETDGDVDLTSTEWLHIDITLRNTAQGVS